jgi:bifunctional non-homologous end joining protein LigD
LSKRRDVMEKSIGSSSKVLLLSHRFATNGLEAFRIAKRRGYEGLVAKDLSSPYVEARSTKWLKVKVHQEDEFVIAGYTEPAGERQYFGALLLGAYSKGRLHYVGKVGTGFGRKSLAMLYRKFQAYVRSRPALWDPPREKGVVFLAPRLIAQISFQEWTADRKLRQPVFLGLRDDKRALEVRLRVCQDEEYQEGRICARNWRSPYRIRTWQARSRRVTANLPSRMRCARA